MRCAKASVESYRRHKHTCKRKCALLIENESITAIRTRCCSVGMNEVFICPDNRGFTWFSHFFCSNCKGGCLRLKEKCRHEASPDRPPHFKEIKRFYSNAITPGKSARKTWKNICQAHSSHLNTFMGSGWICNSQQIYYNLHRYCVQAKRIIRYWKKILLPLTHVQWYLMKIDQQFESPCHPQRGGDEENAGGGEENREWDFIACCS